MDSPLEWMEFALLLALMIGCESSADVDNSGAYQITQELEGGSSVSQYPSSALEGQELELEKSTPGRMRGSKVKHAGQNSVSKMLNFGKLSKVVGGNMKGLDRWNTGTDDVYENLKSDPYHNLIVENLTELFTAISTRKRRNILGSYSHEETHRKREKSMREVFERNLADPYFAAIEKTSFYEEPTEAEVKSCLSSAVQDELFQCEEVAVVEFIRKAKALYDGEVVTIVQDPMILQPVRRNLCRSAETKDGKGFCVQRYTAQPIFASRDNEKDAMGLPKLIMILVESACSVVPKDKCNQNQPIGDEPTGSAEESGVIGNGDESKDLNPTYSGTIEELNMALSHESTSAPGVTPSVMRKRNVSIDGSRLGIESDPYHGLFAKDPSRRGSGHAAKRRSTSRSYEDVLQQRSGSMRDLFERRLAYQSSVERNSKNETQVKMAESCMASATPEGLFSCEETEVVEFVRSAKALFDGEDVIVVQDPMILQPVRRSICNNPRTKDGKGFCVQRYTAQPVFAFRMQEKIIGHPKLIQIIVEAGCSVVPIEACIETPLMNDASKNRMSGNVFEEVARIQSILNPVSENEEKVESVFQPPASTTKNPLEGIIPALTGIDEVLKEILGILPKYMEEVKGMSATTSAVYLGGSLGSNSSIYK